MEKKELEMLAIKVPAINELHSFINLFVPEIQNKLFPGFKINTTGTFSKRDDAKIAEVLGFVNKPKLIRCYPSINRNTIWWRFDISMYSPVWGNAYHETSVCVFEAESVKDDLLHERKIWSLNPFKEFKTDFSFEEIKKAAFTKEGLENKIRMLLEEISVIINQNYPFLERKVIR